MTKSVMGFIKGAGFGMALGCMAGMACHKCMGGKHSVRKNIGRALHNMGELVDNVTDMF